MREFFIKVIYDDDTEFSFTVKIEGEEHHIVAHLMQITRGTLMASSASRSICYDNEGFVVCAYRR